MAQSRTLNTSMSLSLCIRIVSAALAFTTNIVLARWLGPNTFGAYAIVLASVAILSIPVNAGLPALLTRETANSVAIGNNGRLKGLVKFSFGILFLVVFLGAIAAVSSVQLSDTLSLQPEYILAAIALVPIGGIDRLRSSIMQGLGSAIWSQVPETLVRPAIFLLAILVGWWLFNGDNLFYSLVAYGTCALFSFLVGSMLLKRKLGSRLKGITASYETKAWLMSLIPLGLLSATQTLTGSAEILLLGIFGTSIDVGLYKIALQGVAIILLPQAGVSSVLTTNFARSFALKKIDIIISISDKATWLFSSIAAGALVFFMIFGTKIMRLVFGIEYQDALSPLLILAAGQLVSAMSGPVMSLLVMGRDERPAFVSILSGLIVLVLGGVILTPKYGAEGMAIAASTSIITSNILMALAVTRTMNFNPTIFGAFSRRGTNAGI